MMPVKIIMVGSRVHEVGYRLLLSSIAFRLGIQKFEAHNIHIEGKQAILVLAEAPEEKLRKLIDSVKAMKPESAEVDRMDVESYPSDEIQEARDYVMLLQLEQLAKGVSYIARMIETQEKTLKVLNGMLSMLREISGKQDRELEMLKVISGKQGGG